MAFSKRHILSALIFSIFVFSPSAGLGASFKESSPIDHKVEKILFQLVKCDKPGSKLPSVQEMSPLLEFMSVSKRRDDQANPENLNGAAGIYRAYSLDLPFTTSLRYLYNPAIKPETLYPGSLSFNRSEPDTGLLALERPLWEYLGEDLSTPLVLRGRETEEIAPHLQTGTYFRYGLNRLVVLLKHEGKPMLLDISWQDGESCEGKKGSALGPAGNWDFVYTDAAGAASGLDLGNTRIYNSVSVTLFYPQGENRTGYSLFRWMKAGVGGLNVVKAKHIIAGADSAVNGLMSVIGRENRPTPEQLAEIGRKTRAMDDAALLASLSEYSAALSELAKTDPVLSSGDFQEVLSGGSYGQAMPRARLESLVAKNELKRLLGKPVLGLDDKDG